ncbi:hypothetical protein [Providencia rettgeri]
MPDIKFDIPFNQNKLITYFKNDKKNIISNKLSLVKNTSHITNGLCYGLSSAYLCNENKNQGDKLIKTIASQLKKCNQDKASNKFKLLSTKTEEYNYNTSTLNTHLANILNIQINCSRAYNFNYISYNLDSIIGDTVSPKLSLDKKISYLNTKEETNPLIIGNGKNNNLYNILFFLNERKDVINDKILFSKESHEVLKLVNLYYNLLKTENIEFYPKSDLNIDILHKIKNDIELIETEIIDFLKSSFKFLAKNEMYKNTSKKLNFGLVNCKERKINDDENLIFDNDLSSIQELKDRIKSIINNEHVFYSLIIYDNHCMAISIKRNSKNSDYIYKFFDSNKGIKKYKTQESFFDDIEELLSNHSSDKTLIKTLDFPVEIISMESLNNSSYNIL